MAAYQAARTGVAIQKKIGEERTIPGSFQGLIATYLDCSPGSTSPFKALAAETQRTRRNILENLREMHGDKPIYRTDKYGRRVPLLTRVHIQRIINQKSNTPFAQRNLLNTLRAMLSRAPAIALGRKKKSRNTASGTRWERWRDWPWSFCSRRLPVGGML
jgi:hypothetical protein